MGSLSIILKAMTLVSQKEQSLFALFLEKIPKNKTQPEFPQRTEKCETY